MNLVGIEQGAKACGSPSSCARFSRGALVARLRGDMTFTGRCDKERTDRRQYRIARLGRRVVSARVFRRRHAAGVGAQQRRRIDSIAQSWAVLSGIRGDEALALGHERRLHASRPPR
jgi:hypothetical protein